MVIQFWFARPMENGLDLHSAEVGNSQIDTRHLNLETVLHFTQLNVMTFLILPMVKFH